MNKSFLSVSPSEGNGNAQVVINVKENMSLDERSESLRIRTSNGVEKQVRITQDPGMIFFPTMQVSGIQVGQGEKKFLGELYSQVNQGGSTYPLEDKRKELEDLDRGWYLKDDWSYVGCNWNMDSSEGSHIPSATLDYDPGDGYYKTIFEWIFSDGIDNILPQ